MPRSAHLMPTHELSLSSGGGVTDSQEKRRRFWTCDGTRVKNWKSLSRQTSPEGFVSLPVSRKLVLLPNSCRSSSLSQTLRVDGLSLGVTTDCQLQRGSSCRLILSSQSLLITTCGYSRISGSCFCRSSSRTQMQQRVVWSRDEEVTPMT